MANASSPSHIYASYSGNLNGTFMTNSCPSSETDYTIYFKVALILVFLVASALISGFAALASPIRSLAQAVQDHRCHICHSHAQDVEAHPSTSLLEKASEVGPPGKAPRAAQLSDDGLSRDTPYLSSPQHPSSPPSREKRGRKLWKKVQTAVSNGGWATHAMNAAALAASCVLSGPPSMQYNLPTPVTESGRSQ